MLRPGAGIPLQPVEQTRAGAGLPRRPAARRHAGASGKREEEGVAARSSDGLTAAPISPIHRCCIARGVWEGLGELGVRE